MDGFVQIRIDPQSEAPEKGAATDGPVNESPTQATHPATAVSNGSHNGVDRTPVAEPVAEHGGAGIASAKPIGTAGPTAVTPEGGPQNNHGSDSPAGGLEGLRDRIVAALKSVYDPEIPVDIYELGLIYEIDISEHCEVDVKMTLTAPGCPVAGTLPGEVEQRVQLVEGVLSATVELVWDPPWTPDRMTEAAKLELGML